MPTLLRIDSSANGELSRSRAVTGAFAEAWSSVGDARRVIHRDLHADPPQHLPSSALHWNAGLVAGARPPAWERRQRELIDELLSADLLVVAVPLYNYSMPSTLKAWVDHVHVPGVTAGTPRLPLAGRHAVLVSARGARYGTPAAPDAWDHGTAALEVVLGASMGMTTHRIVCEGTIAFDLEQFAAKRADAQLSLDAALSAARSLAAEL
ncbi:MAG TPA: NAD(P)H-dependent oxidoreductase [Pseudolysinimonas sp.]|jgi:FMN-dependent NADH-azoreductase